MKKETAKIKFFAQRDWHILHFLLTIFLAIALGYCLIQAPKADQYYETIYGDINELHSKVHNLEENAGLKSLKDKNGNWILIPKNQE